MPIATPEVYAQMLDTAKQQGFAFPAINVTSTQTLNAALKGFADAGSDGIVQISTGGAEYLSGQAVKDMVTGATALAEFAHVVADKYPVHVALHTDHCPKDKLDGYMRPLIAISRDRVERGQEPLFQSHMWDGSAVPLKENLDIAAELLAGCAAARVIMEMEIGVVAARRTASSARSTRSCTPLRRTPWPPPTRSGSASAAGTSWPPRSATCTASTSRGTSSCARRCSRRFRTRWAPSMARTSRSTWSSTAGPGRRWRRSGRRSPTAWSR